MGDDFLNNLKQTITETAEVVGKKTEDLVEIQKLRNKVRNAEKNVEMDYRKLGEIIFQRFSDGEVMDGELAEIVMVFWNSENRYRVIKKNWQDEKDKISAPPVEL